MECTRAIRHRDLQGPVPEESAAGLPAEPAQDRISKVCLYIRMRVCVHALTWETCYLRSKRNNERHDINPLKTQTLAASVYPISPALK